MRLSTLTFIAFYVNSAIDTGNYDDILIDEMKAEIRRGTVFDFLRDRLSDDMDLTILSASDEAELLAEWQGLLEAVSERRKMGIEKRGLTLILAYLLEGIQQRGRALS